MRIPKCYHLVATFENVSLYLTTPIASLLQPKELLCRIAREVHEGVSVGKDCHASVTSYPAASIETKRSQKVRPKIYQQCDFL